MSETLKAVEAAAYRLAKAQAKKRIIEQSLNGIIAEQRRKLRLRKPRILKVEFLNPIKAHFE